MSWITWLLVVLAAPAMAGGMRPQSCAEVLFRQGGEWLVARLPTQPMLMHLSAPPSTLALTVESRRSVSDLERHSYRWDGSDFVLPDIRKISWSAGIEPERYRPSAWAPDRVLRATIVYPGSTRVALHGPHEIPSPNKTIYFALAREDRAETPTGGAWDGHLEVPPAAMLPASAPLDLSFSPDGAALLGHNALGLEVYTVAPRERRVALRARPDARLAGAGWISSDEVADISVLGHVRTAQLDGSVVSQGRLALWARPIQAAIVHAGGVTGVLVHVPYEPLVFRLYDPHSLALQWTVRVTGVAFGKETYVDKLWLVPEGVAVADVYFGNEKRRVAINVAGAMRQGLEELHWHAPLRESAH